MKFILTKENYFSVKANMEYMSVSQYKSFCKCEACALAEAKGLYVRPTTTALLVGSYVDAFYEGTIDQFKADHPEIFTAKGDLKAEYRKADEMIARTQADRFFLKHMSGDKQVIMTGEISGVKFKVKIDSLRKGGIDDLKTVRDFENIYVPEKGSVPFFEAWGYDIQGAVYQEIVRQNRKKVLPFFLDCVSKEDVPDIDVIEIEQDTLNNALEEVKARVPRFDAIKRGIIKPERCGKCEWCKRTKKLKAPHSSDDFYMI